jgi:hypothetical protein
MISAVGGTHWGAIASGVGGIATAGALFISLILLRIQQRDLRQARADQHKKHASRLAFWVELGAVDADADTVEVIAHIENTSDRPFLRLTAEVGLNFSSSIGKWAAAAIGPRAEITPTFVFNDVDPLRFESVGRNDWEVFGELRFHDAAGWLWLRTGPVLLELTMEVWDTLDDDVPLRDRVRTLIDRYDPALNAAYYFMEHPPESRRLGVRVYRWRQRALRWARRHHLLKPPPKRRRYVVAAEPAADTEDNTAQR